MDLACEMESLRELKYNPVPTKINLALTMPFTFPQRQCVQRICLDLGMKDTPHSLFKKNQLSALGNHLFHIAETRCASTAIIYTSHLKSFMNFLESTTECLSQREFKAGKKVFKKWRSRLRAYGRKYSKARAKVQIDSADIKAMLSSECCDRAGLILERGRELGDILTPTEAVCVRDSLWIRIILLNACRSGDIVNLSCGELNNAQRVESNYVISVLNHKTARTYGPSSLVVTQELYSDLLAYLKLRPGPKGEDQALFLNRNGKKASTDLLLHVLRRTFPGPESMKATLLRSHVVSYTHKHKGAEEKFALARKMCHSVQTASAHYQTQTSLEEAVHGSMLVREALNLLV